MAEGTTADKGPTGVEAPPFGAHLFDEVNGRFLQDALKPLESKLLTAEELDTLCHWLNVHQNSAMAQDIKKKRLWCYGKPVGERVPCLRWLGGLFRRDSLWLVGGWVSLDRAVLRG